MSIWRRPKNPARKPTPRAWEFSCSKTNDASFTWSFSKASLNLSKLSPSAGYIPE